MLATFQCLSFGSVSEVLDHVDGRIAMTEDVTIPEHHADVVRVSEARTGIECLQKCQENFPMCAVSFHNHLGEWSSKNVNINRFN